MVRTRTGFAIMMGTPAAGVTASVAGLLVALPLPFLTTTLKVAPLSAEIAA